MGPAIIRRGGLLVLLSAAGGGSVEEAAGRKHDWFVTPIVAYTTDDGLGFGARVELAVREPGYQPHRVAYMLQGYASLKEYHFHRFRYDRIDRMDRWRLRITASGVYRQWGNDGYWGIGNATVREREYLGDFEPGDPLGRRYAYRLIQPFLQLTLRAEHVSSWALTGTLNGKWSRIDTYARSLLEAERPYGIDGGASVLLSAGVLYDSRHPEANPERGHFFEVSGFGALPNHWGPGGFGGLFACLRSYKRLTSFLVLAWRVMTEMMVGEVPFFEMVYWHGSVPIAGFGGYETIRGIPFGRWRAPSKAVGNLELRFGLVEHTLFGRSVEWQFSLFGDGGLVWGARSETQSPGPQFPLHLAAGLGVRVIYAGSFVIRLDAALGDDPILESTGEVSHDLSSGIYLVFDQSF
jgi:hypothetical protein